MAVRRKTKSVLAYRLLKECLQNGTFATGEQITEAKTAETFGLGRVPVREAILRLEAEGLLKSPGPHRGKFVEYVEDIKPEEVIWRYGVREIVEGRAAWLAARNMTGLQINRLRKFAEEVQRCFEESDHKGYLNNNRGFHDFLMANCGNPLLYDIWQEHHLMPLTPKSASMEAKITANMAENEGSYGQMEIIDVIASHDADMAERCVRRYIHKMTEALCRTFKSPQADSADVKTVQVDLASKSIGNRRMPMKQKTTAGQADQPIQSC